MCRVRHGSLWAGDSQLGEWICWVPQLLQQLPPLPAPGALWTAAGAWRVHHTGMRWDAALEGLKAEQTLLVRLQVLRLTVQHAQMHVDPNLDGHRAGLDLLHHLGILQALDLRSCYTEVHKGAPLSRQQAELTPRAMQQMLRRAVRCIEGQKGAHS